MESSDFQNLNFNIQLKIFDAYRLLNNSKLKNLNLEIFKNIKKLLIVCDTDLEKSVTNLSTRAMMINELEFFIKKEKKIKIFHKNTYFFETFKKIEISCNQDSEDIFFLNLKKIFNADINLENKNNNDKKISFKKKINLKTNEFNVLEFLNDNNYEHFSPSVLIKFYNNILAMCFKTKLINEIEFKNTYQIDYFTIYNDFFKNNDLNEAELFIKNEIEKEYIDFIFNIKKISNVKNFNLTSVNLVNNEALLKIINKLNNPNYEINVFNDKFIINISDSFKNYEDFEKLIKNVFKINILCGLTKNYKLSRCEADSFVLETKTINLKKCYRICLNKTNIKLNFKYQEKKLLTHI